MTYVNFAMTTLLNGIWQGTLLAAAMWLLIKLLPRLNSTTRFTVLWATLLAVVGLPLGPLMSGVFMPTAQTKSPAATANNPTTTAADVHELKSGLQKTAAIPESHRKSISKAEPGPVSEQAPASVDAQTTARRSASPAMTAIGYPLIRIRSEKIMTALEIIWAVLSFVMFVRISFGYRELRRLKAAAIPAPAESQLRLRRLGTINGVRRQTQLLVSGRIPAPMSLGFFNPAILIPQALLDTLSDSELEHVMLHELAHVRRWDDWSNFAQKLMGAILPIQPAIYWIGHRMAIEREMACDDWVIATTGAAKPYAASLTKVAELSQWGDPGVLAVGATGNRSQLFSRVHHMLDRTRNAAPKLALGPLGTALAAVVAMIYLGARAPQVIAFAATSPQPPASPLSAPVPQSPTAPQSPTSPQSPASPQSPPAPLAPVSAQQGGETHMNMTTSNGWSSLTVKLDGVIEFTDDDRDVKSLSPGGHFRLEEGTWLSGRVYDVKADSAGNLTKTYSLGRSMKPMDAEGRAWLEHMLPQVIRDSAMGAGPRVTRILRQGGPQAVLTEIGLIHSDGSKRIYLEQLFSQATLNPQQLQDSARLIRGISSDGDKAQVIVTVDEKYFTGELRPSLFEAARSISSDGDKRRVLSDILKKDGGNADTLLSVARTAKHISSDGDKAEVLIEMADSYRASDGLAMAYFEALKSISSDGDHARVLESILAAHGDDRDTLVWALRSAEKISSDGDKARVLKKAVSRYSDDELVRKAFFDAANSISSDGDHQQVLVTLVHRKGNAAPTLGAIANSAQRISSDGDKARVLVELAEADVEPVSKDFFAAADSISSDGDHSHVLTAVLDKPGTSNALAISAIQSATHISSDGDKGRVLLDAANRYSKDPVVDAALRKAVESLHSDGEYRSVMSEISRHGGGI